MTVASELISRADKGGLPDGRQGGRNALEAQGCIGRQRPGGQVGGNNTASSVWVVEAGGNGRLFGQAVQDRNKGGKLGAKSVVA